MYIVETRTKYQPLSPRGKFCAVLASLWLLRLGLDAVMCEDITHQHDAAHNLSFITSLLHFFSRSWQLTSTALYDS